MLAATPAREAGLASSGEVYDLRGCNGRKKAQTWLFKSCVCLKEGQTFSNLLDARKQQMNISLASATVISWACTNNALRQSQDGPNLLAASSPRPMSLQCRLEVRQSTALQPAFARELSSSSFGGLFFRFCCPFWSLCRKWEKRV